MDEKKDKEPLKLKPEFTAAAMSLASAITAYHSGNMRALNICFPAVIRSYDRSTHIAEVVPLIKQGYFDGEWKYVNRQPYKVSVRSIQCGGFTIDIPLYVGDTGWVFSSDRDTLLLKQDGAFTSAVLDKDRPLCMVDSAYQQKPAQPLLHDFSRGFFIPDNWGERDPDRFKDNESVNTNGALYIGASFDTKDDDENFDTNEDDTDLLDEDVLEEIRNNRETDETSKTLKKKLQKGEDYEDSLASSLVIERQGGLNILSGSPVQDVALDWRETARLSVHKDTIFSEVMDNRNGAMLQSTISPDGGILVRTFDNYYSSLSGSNTTIEVKDGCAIIQIRKDLIISLKEGNITIYTDSGATINSNGNINVESEKDVTIFGGGTVMAKEGAEITAKDYVSVNSNLLSINSGRDVTIETAEKLELSGRVNFRCNDTYINM